MAWRGCATAEVRAAWSLRSTGAGSTWSPRNTGVQAPLRAGAIKICLPVRSVYPLCGVNQADCDTRCFPPPPGCAITLDGAKPRRTHGRRGVTERKFDPRRAIGALELLPGLFPAAAASKMQTALPGLRVLHVVF